MILVRYFHIPAGFQVRKNISLSRAFETPTVQESHITVMLNGTVQGEGEIVAFESSELSSHAVVTENSLCDSIESYVFPKTAKTRENQWRLVVFNLFEHLKKRLDL